MEIEHYKSRFKAGAGMMEQGKSDEEIIDYQIQYGLKSEQAEYLLKDLLATRDARFLKKARNEMIAGILMIAIGVFGWVLTYQRAVEAGGGPYVITYGIIIAGILYIGKGLHMKFIQEKPEPR